MKKVPLKTDQNNPAILAYKEAVEKGRKDQHVLPRENGWVVKSLLSEKTSQTFETQQEATSYAQSIASQGTAIFIHGTDGRIQDRREY
jgi:hypothetical protein